MTPPSIASTVSESSSMSASVPTDLAVRHGFEDISSVTLSPTSGPPSPRNEDDRSSREGSPEASTGEGSSAVRQIARRWRSAEVGCHGGPHPRLEWLGEVERERVRLVREWVRMGTEHRESRSIRRAAAAEGDLSDHEDGPPEHIRRDMLRIRGRQARLELIMRMAQDRQAELQSLSNQHAVSNFAHRNRIQAFLRGRFLRNGSSMEEERLPSAAETELGQLRQRHTVSGMREEFRVRLERVVNGHLDREADIASALNGEVFDNNHSQPSPRENENMDTSQTRILNSDNQRIEISLTDNLPDSISDVAEDQQNSQLHVDDLQREYTEHDMRDLVGRELVSLQHSENGEVSGISRESNDNLQFRSRLMSSVTEDTVDSEVQQEIQIDSLLEEDAERDITNIGQPYEAGNSENGEESVTTWQENTDEVSSSGTQESIRDAGVQHLSVVHEEWYHDDDDSHESEENWHGGHQSPLVDRPLHGRRPDWFIPADDDNVYRSEIRELLNRRSVSNLLHSGFRESLDHIIQSYIERQEHGPLEWDVEESSSPVHDLIEGNQDRQRDDNMHEILDTIIDRPPGVIPNPPAPPPRPVWPPSMRNGNWLRQRMDRLEHMSEWDAINDLRADMARIQQGMSNMQRMLETCMEMQLELQRAVRQEVSAALNRFVGQHVVATGENRDSIINDGSKWTHVRKGTCCICCKTPVDSLLYRCGHMCTCSNCANELVREGGKCPLCRAPIKEVVRAYFIM